MKYIITRTQTITVEVPDDAPDATGAAIDAATNAFWGDSDPDEVTEEWEVEQA